MDIKFTYTWKDTPWARAMRRASAVPLTGWSLVRSSSDAQRMRQAERAVKVRRVVLTRLYEKGAFPGKDLLWLQYLRNCPPMFVKTEPLPYPCNLSSVCPFCWPRIHLARTLRLVKGLLGDGPWDILTMSLQTDLSLAAFEDFRGRLLRTLRRWPLRGFVSLAYPAGPWPWPRWCLRLLLVHGPGQTFRWPQEDLDTPGLWLGYARPDAKALHAATALCVYPESYLQPESRLEEVLPPCRGLRRWNGSAVCRQEQLLKGRWDLQKVVERSVARARHVSSQLEAYHGA